MSFFGWLFRRNKAKHFEPWEKIATAGRDHPVQETRRYLADCDYLLPKDQEDARNRAALCTTQPNAWRVSKPAFAGRAKLAPDIGALRAKP